MDRDELARAIEQPAARAGLELERGLADALVSDVVGEPGGLPLLSTTLLELWRARDGRALRYDSYRTSGGVRGAVARLADDAYTRLGESERRIARGVMLRLASGEDGALARRRVPLGELERITGARPVLAELTDARLLTVSDGEVELSHEALLREWPRYRAWLEEDRIGRRVHAHLDRGRARLGRAWARRRGRLPGRAAGRRAGVAGGTRAGAQPHRAGLPRRKPGRGRARAAPSADGARRGRCPAGRRRRRRPGRARSARHRAQPGAGRRGPTARRAGADRTAPGPRVAARPPGRRARRFTSPRAATCSRRCCAARPRSA